MNLMLPFGSDWKWFLFIFSFVVYNKLKSESYLNQSMGYGLQAGYYLSGS